jgi:hypothetical protein
LNYFYQQIPLQPTLTSISNNLNFIHSPSKGSLAPPCAVHGLLEVEVALHQLLLLSPAAAAADTDTDTNTASTTSGKSSSSCSSSSSMTAVGAAVSALRCAVASLEVTWQRKVLKKLLAQATVS